jgi:hypothetical protein
VANPAFASGFGLDPLDTVLLEVRAPQLEKLAEAAEKAGDRNRARYEINRCLDVLAAAVHRDPAGRDYFGEYHEMLALARKLGVSTRDLQ